MNRRRFLASAAAGMAIASTIKTTIAGSLEPGGGKIIMTVRGPISPDSLGLTLPHEHVLVDFIGASLASPARYDFDQAFEAILPWLKQLYTLGGRALAECTPQYLGRDVKLLQKLSAASGIHLLTNSGYYAAANEKFLPAHAFTESADQLAERWIHESKHGIDGTDVHPGFIKIGVDKSPLSIIDEKLVRAAAHTHLNTGLVIASHTKTGQAALQQLAILREEGVDGQAFIWVHAGEEKDPTFHDKAAEQGAWLEFDKLAPDSVEEHVALVKTMQSHGRLGQTLISHDAGWYNPGQPGGGSFRPYDTLFTHFLPKLKEAGLSDLEVNLITIGNPAKAFVLGIKNLTK